MECGNGKKIFKVGLDLENICVVCVFINNNSIMFIDVTERLLLTKSLKKMKLNVGILKNSTRYI